MAQQKEKMKAVLILSMLFCFTSGIFAQQKSYINPGLLTASATLSPAVMLNRSDVNYYLNGFLEGRLDKHISLRGELHYMLGNASEKFLNRNIRTTFGLQYGFPFGNFEIHTGFAPGFSIMESNRNLSVFEFVPTVQLNAGVRYYVWKYFNFFSNFSYVHSKMNNLNQTSGMADEFVFAVGLGLNFQVLKKYRE